MSSAAPVPGPTEILKAFIEQNTTRKDWAGKDWGYPVKWNQFSLTSEMRARVNEAGMKYGCHTGTSDHRLEIDRTQPWVGDHFPPTNLSKHARLALAELTGDQNFINGSSTLFAQCQECSNRQATLVRKLNSMSGKEIGLWLKNDEEELQQVCLLTIGWTQTKHGKTCLKASGPKVQSIERSRIQNIGEQLGCHSDPDHNVPCTVYHADHVWPQEFCTSYMDKLLEKLGLLHLKPKQQMLRPQCPKCSGAQGGSLSGITKMAIEYAKSESGEIVVYK